MKFIPIQNGSSTKAWTDLLSVETEEDHAHLGGGSDDSASERKLPEFITNLPRDLGVHNLNVNSNLFRTVEDQDKAFAGRYSCHRK